MDCAKALFAHLPAAKVANFADPFTEAVAPVTMSEGGCVDVFTASSRSGSVFWAKLKKPRLD
jgi:hypothetical protein